MVQVTVSSTPNGRADAICHTGQQAYFALPAEAQVPLSEALQQFEEERHGEARDQILYIQAQNNSLKLEFPMLLKDMDAELPWATAAFGTQPEAVNVWIGNHRSVTSVHRDHYENIYAVISGTKRFRLLPPSDRYRLHMLDVPAARYQQTSEGWQLNPEVPRRTVTWCPIELQTAAEARPGPAILEKFPQFFDASLPAPLEVDVHAGQVLYLPSMWYHMVEQQDDVSGRVIAVNYWYDMQFDCKYAYSQLIEDLCRICQSEA